MSATAFQGRRHGQLMTDRGAQALARIRANPGIGVRELARLLGVSATTSGRILGKLRVQGRVGVTIRQGGHSYYAPQDAATWQRAVTARDACLAKLDSWLASQAPLAQKDVLDYAEAELRWPRSTTQHRLGRLTQHQAIRVRRHGRRRRYVQT